MKKLLLIAPSDAERAALRSELEAAGFEVFVGVPRRESLARNTRWNAFRREPSALDGVVIDARVDGAIEVLDAIRLRAMELPVVLLFSGESTPKPRLRHARTSVLGRPASAVDIGVALESLTRRQ